MVNSDVMPKNYGTHFSKYRSITLLNVLKILMFYFIYSHGEVDRCSRGTVTVFIS